MKTARNETVEQYLAAVEREASALPPERRQELLADLAEHVDVALAERPEGDPAAVREVLRELGDPRTIATTALREAGPHPAGAGHPTAGPAVPPPAGPGYAPGGPARRGGRERISPWCAVVLLAVASPLSLVAPALLTGVVRIAGVVMLWLTPSWPVGRRWIATLVTVLVIAVPNTIALLTDVSGMGAAGIAALTVAQFVVPLAVSVWLWRTARRPESGPAA